jgi:probable HAF family extracellular repeat protein
MHVPIGTILVCGAQASCPHRHVRMARGASPIPGAATWLHRRAWLSVCGALLLAAGAPATPAAAVAPAVAVARPMPIQPVPVDLGTLPGGTDSRALGENEEGQVVGWSYTTLDNHPAVHAFSWTEGGGMVDLSSLVSFGGADSAASEVSDNGQIAGYSFTRSELPHAYSWTRAGGLVDLGTLPGGSESRATRVNNRGQIVGWADTTSIQSGADSGIRHAFSWTQAGGMVDLGTFGGSASTAAAVSDSGQVVGFSDLASGAWHAFLWTQAAGMRDLGTLGGSTSDAHAINDDGQVVGQSTTAKNGPTHAFSWTQAGGMVDLGTLGSGISIARGVSNNGEVVGYSNTAKNGPTHAFSWTQAGGMVELDPLPGDSSSYAEAVNDSGQVVGWSVDAAGHSHAALWQLPAMRISALRLTPANFRAERHGSSTYLKTRRGAKVTFRLSAPTLVTFTLQRVLSGRLRGKDCVRDSRLLRRLPPCTRQALRGSFRQVGRTGVNAVPLSAARLNAARLGPGNYLLSATAPGPNGTLSGPIRFRFTVKPPRLG